MERRSLELRGASPAPGEHLPAEDSRWKGLPWAGSLPLLCGLSLLINAFHVVHTTLHAEDTRETKSLATELTFSRERWTSNN